MEKFHLRPFTPADTQAVVDVINAASLQVLGYPRGVVDAVGNIWAFKFIPFTSEKIVAVNEQGQIIGYAYFINGDNIVTELGGAVQPEYWNQGVGSALIEWAEALATAASQNGACGDQNRSANQSIWDRIQRYSTFHRAWFCARPRVGAFSDPTTRTTCCSISAGLDHP